MADKMRTLLYDWVSPMTFKHATGYTVTFAALLGLAGCIGSDSNSSEAGLVVHLAETHFENSPVATAALRIGETATAQQTINSSSKSIVTSDQASAAEAATLGG
ncbi:MAG: hypothetical protein FD130_1972, partial [Halothiobacillaceae bacterium]